MPQHSAKRRSLIVSLVLLCSACAVFPDLVLRDRDHPLAGKIWDPANASFIDEKELLRRATRAEILLLGEPTTTLSIIAFSAGPWLPAARRGRGLRWCWNSSIPTSSRQSTRW